MTTASAPREFWIEIFLWDPADKQLESRVYHTQPKHWPNKPTELHVHVIEYSAYEALKKERDELLQCKFAWELSCKQSNTLRSKLALAVAALKDVIRNSPDILGKKYCTRVLIEIGELEEGS